MKSELSFEQKQNLETIAYDQIKAAIVKGIFPPGYQIVEEIVAEQLNMSRSPVRIAIKRLQSEGFLEKYPNRRVYVTLGDYKRTIDALYVRKALEGIAAYQAAINRTNDDIARIKAHMAEMRRYYETGDAFNLLKMGTEVHRAIYIASKNTFLAQVGINALDQEAVFSYRSITTDPIRAEQSYQEHDAIMQAILLQDPVLAEQNARNHVDQLIKRAQFSSPDSISKDPDLLLFR